MRYSLFAFILCAAFCFGQDKPPVVPPKAPEVQAQWFKTQPPVDPGMQLMLDHPKAVFDVLHDEDMELCTNGPSPEWLYPLVQRCDGAI